MITFSTNRFVHVASRPSVAFASTQRPFRPTRHDKPTTSLVTFLWSAPRVVFVRPSSTCVKQCGVVASTTLWN